jgi:NTE family protein
VTSGAPRSVALALGAGGSRGLAHIPVLEAFDELGVRPTAIAGASLGALIGAGYAAGMTAKETRNYVVGLLRDRGEVMRRLLSVRVGRVVDLLATGNPVLADAEAFVDQFLPVDVPAEFSVLRTPLVTVATDFWQRKEVVIRSGPLRSALAASIAVPGLFRPVEREGCVLVDGGTTNPLPFDLLRGQADIVVAVDVTGGPTRRSGGIPNSFEALFATIGIMAHAIVGEKLKSGAPEILLQPNVSAFGMLDFFRATPILRASEPIKDEVKSKLGALLEL